MQLWQVGLLNLPTFLLQILTLHFSNSVHFLQLFCWTCDASTRMLVCLLWNFKNKTKVAFRLFIFCLITWGQCLNRHQNFIRLEVIIFTRSKACGGHTVNKWKQRLPKLRHQRQTSPLLFHSQSFPASLLLFQLCFPPPRVKFQKTAFAACSKEIKIFSVLGLSVTAWQPMANGYIQILSIELQRIFPWLRRRCGSA